MRENFWDRVAGVYDLAESLNRSAGEAIKQAVAELTPEGGSVLECAAGTGELSLAAAAKAGKVLCTDRSLPMLARAQEKAWRQGFTNIEFARRDLLALPKNDGPFDMVIAANVLHLLEEPQKALCSLAGVVKPVGRLVVPTFLQGETRPVFKAVIEAYKLLGFRYKYAFTLESYRALLTESGLGPVEVARIPGKVPVGLGIIYLEKGKGRSL